MTNLVIRFGWLLSCAAITLGLAGCATLPDEGPRSYTSSLPVRGDATPLDRLAQASMAGAPAGESGFRLLLGPGALDVRLALMRDARRSLDLQYYHLHNDVTGRLVMRELRNAAQRGVRVRLLLDDLYTDGLETLIAGLGAFPNVEVRLFNPFPVRGSIVKRFGASAMQFARLNHRMHNKLFVADGTLAITGGRNLGDEYFMRSAEWNFFDYEVLCAGPVVPQMSSLFDEYWNAEQVRTATSVLRTGESPQLLRAAFDAWVAPDRTPEPVPFRGAVDRIGPPAYDELLKGRVALAFGKAQAFADSPAKAWGELETARLPSGALLDSSRLLIATEFARTRHEVWISSPYVVPGAATLESIRGATQRGVKINLLTNSLATTDEPVVHTGYRRYRDNMLRAGVQVFELHPLRSQRMLEGTGAGEGTLLRLHTKAAVIDGAKVFIGSVNFDPRSEALNTEFGVFVDSPVLAAQALAIFARMRDDATWRVRLKPDTERDLQWVRSEGEKIVELIELEPGADLWTRAKLYIQSFVIPESLL